MINQSRKPLVTYLEAKALSAASDAVAPELGLPERVSAILSRQPGHDELREAMALFPNFEVALCGGTVRDLLLGRPHAPKDFDLLLSGEPVSRALEVLRGTGSFLATPFGSPRWYPTHDLSLYWDLMPVRSFDNGLWACEDVIDVLNQFDFTANAVAVDLRSGVFHDPQHGRREIERRIMRAVRLDCPDEPIAPGQTLTRTQVLWFRILHYAAELGFAVEPVTLAWLRRHRDFRRLADLFEATFFPLHANYLRPLAG